MEPLVIELEATTVAHETGVWCPTCSLPSAYTAEVVVTTKSSPDHVLRRLTTTACDGCSQTTTAVPSWVQCDACNGKGLVEVIDHRAIPWWVHRKWEPCRGCEGRGGFMCGTTS